ncbi:MAG TPA: hypothetical protein VL171_15720 [Verrucomicrobiae bacterium]|nr:hypothetical protein [Verrucomicrobiae bacterium]
MGDARSRLSLWKEELTHVEQGEVKFNNRWMTPEEKKPLVEKFLQWQRVQKLAAVVRDLQNEVGSYERRRNELTGAIVSTQQTIVNCQSTVNNPPRTSVATPRVIPGTPPRYDASGRLIQTGSPARRGPDRVSYRVDYQAVNAAQQRIASCQSQLVQMQQEIATLNKAIGTARQRLAQTESEHKIAYAEAAKPVVIAQQPVAATQVVAAVATPPVVEPVVSRQPTEPPKPWIIRKWKALAIIGGILLILAVLTPLVLRKVEMVQQERDKERRVAREHLKKIFDQIFVQGERPSGKNTPEGEIIPFGNGHVGGEQWFVVGPDYIWAVQNNARDDDNWVLNNVETGGPGAIGARVMTEQDIVSSIKTFAQAGS